MNKTLLHQDNFVFKSISQCKDKTLRLDYFAIFDGHAGEGAALYAMDVLHEILIEKIREVQHLLLVEDQSNPALPDCLLGTYIHLNFDSNIRSQYIFVI